MLSVQQSTTRTRAMQRTVSYALCTVCCAVRSVRAACHHRPSQCSTDYSPCTKSGRDSAVLYTQGDVVLILKCCSLCTTQQCSAVCVIDSTAHAVEYHEYCAAKKCNRQIYSLCTVKQKLVKLVNDECTDCLDGGVDLSYICKQTHACI